MPRLRTPCHHQHERENRVTRDIVLHSEFIQSVRIHHPRSQMSLHLIQYGKFTLRQFPCLIECGQEFKLTSFRCFLRIGLCLQCKKIGKPFLRMKFLHSIVDKYTTILRIRILCQHESHLCREIGQTLRIDGAQLNECFFGVFESFCRTVCNPRTYLTQYFPIFLFCHSISVQSNGMCTDVYLS